MSLGKASHILRRKVLFSLVQKLNEDICFRCKKKILNASELSIEHKEDYLDSSNPIELFFDLDNITFSHIKCNVGARRKGGPPRKHPSMSSWRRGCRCTECTRLHTEAARSYRKRNKNSS